MARLFHLDPIQLQGAEGGLAAIPWQQILIRGTAGTA